MLVENVVAAQGRVFQVRDYLCSYEEYGQGVIPFHGEGERYCY